jgi:hypothetical protein
MIVDMRHTVPRQHLEIAKTEEARVANLNCIPKITGKEQKNLSSREQNSSADIPCR